MSFPQPFRGRVTLGVVAILVIAAIASPEAYKISIVSLVAATCLAIDFFATRTRSSGLLVVVFVGLAALAWPRTAATHVVRPSPTALYPAGARDGEGVAPPSTNAAIRSRVEQAAGHYLPPPSHR